MLLLLCLLLFISTFIQQNPVYISTFLIYLPFFSQAVNTSFHFRSGSSSPDVCFPDYLVYPCPSYPEAPICEALTQRAREKTRGLLCGALPATSTVPPGRQQQSCSKALSVCCLYQPPTPPHTHLHPPPTPPELVTHPSAMTSR